VVSDEDHTKPLAKLKAIRCCAFETSHLLGGQHKWQTR